MAAFGPVLGFLLGAYLLSFHMDSFSGNFLGTINQTDRRFIGMWWFGFLLCGFLLVIIAVPFFSFPKILTREKKKIRLTEQQHRQISIPANNSSNSLPRQQPPTSNQPPQKPSDSNNQKDSGYGKDIKGMFIHF